MIYTGRYQYRLRDDSHYAVRTTRSAPRFPVPYTLMHNLWQLAPPYPLRGLPEAVFRAEYFRYLDGVGIDNVIMLLDALERDAGGKDVLLLCFCGPDHEYCHRHIFAEWFARETGVTIREFPG